MIQPGAELRFAHRLAQRGADLAQHFLALRRVDQLQELFAALLGDDGVLRVQPADPAAEDGLRAVVGDGDGLRAGLRLTASSCCAGRMCARCTAWHRAAAWRAAGNNDLISLMGRPVRGYGSAAASIANALRSVRQGDAQQVAAIDHRAVIAFLYLIRQRLHAAAPAQLMHQHQQPGCTRPASAASSRVEVWTLP